MKFYQACYGKDDSGWGMFNISDDIPADALVFFEKIGSNCNPHIVDDKICEDFEIYKIVSNEQYSCVFKSKYSGKDKFGRPTMFTHGFIIDSFQYKNDPDSILNISSNNHKYSIAESSVFPTTLQPDIYKIPFVLNDDFLKSIYILLTSKYDFPLYVICDCSQKLIKTIIYYILTALPISLRANLSFTNSDITVSSSEKIIVFTNVIPENKYYYSIDDNKNNLTNELENFDANKDIYPSYYRKINLNDEEFLNYCIELEENLKSLNLSSKCTVENIALADKLTYSRDDIERMEDRALLIYLRELLLNLPLRNSYWDEFISIVLEVCEKRKIKIPLPILKKLTIRFENTDNAKYKEIFINVCNYLFSQSNTDYINYFLSWQYERAPSFYEKWNNALTSIHIQADYSELCMLIAKSFHSTDDYQNISKYFNLNQFNQDLQNDFIKQFITVVNSDLSTLPFEEFKRIYQQISIIANAFPKRRSFIYNNISANYWKAFKLDCFEFDEKIISALKLIQPIPTDIAKLIDIYDISIGNDFNKTEYVVYEFLNQKSSSELSHRNICKKLFHYLYQTASDESKTTNFQFWYLLSSNIDVDRPLNIMLTYKMPVLCNIEYFSDELPKITKSLSKLDSEFSDEILQCHDEILTEVLLQNQKILRQKNRNNKIKNILNFKKGR